MLTRPCRRSSGGQFCGRSPKRPYQQPPDVRLPPRLNGHTAATAARSGLHDSVERRSRRRAGAPGTGFSFMRIGGCAAAWFPSTTQPTSSPLHLVLFIIGPFQELIDQSEGRSKRRAETKPTREPTPGAAARPASRVGAGRPPLHPPSHRPPSQQADSVSLSLAGRGTQAGRPQQLVEHLQQQRPPQQAPQAQQPNMQWLLPAAWQATGQAPAAWQQGLSQEAAAGGVPPRQDRLPPAPSTASVGGAGRENGSSIELALGTSQEEQLQQGQQQEQGQQQAAPPVAPPAAEPSAVQGVQTSLPPERVQAMLLQLVLPVLARSKPP